MPHAQTAHTRDAFVSLDLEAHSDFANWTELLADTKRHKGLCRITVEFFAGRAGFREIGELKCTTKEEGAIENSGDVANVNAPAVAGAAFQLAQAHHKREAMGRYRLQLWHVKKKTESPVRGDYATIAFSGDGSQEIYSQHDASTLAIKILASENKELREFVSKLLGSQVEMGQGNAAVLLNALELGKITADQRMQLAEQVANMQTRASPADWNARWETTTRNLRTPLTILASKLAHYIPTPGGPGGPGGPGPGPGPGPNAGGPGFGPTPGNDMGHAQARAFFDSLSGEQTDKLRDGMPPGCFQAVAETIHGPFDQWLADREDLFGILRNHQALLVATLTPEQLAQLMTLAGN